MPDERLNYIWTQTHGRIVSCDDFSRVRMAQRIRPEDWDRFTGKMPAVRSARNRLIDGLEVHDR